MNRRDAITALLALGAAAGPLDVLAQRQIRTIGLLWNDSVNPSPHVATFLDALREKGYVLDRDIRIENRVSLEGYRRMGASASDLVRGKADVIVTIGATATLAAAKATKLIPIVGIIGTDPVAFGLATSLAHPEGNFTGVTSLVTDLHGKRLQLLGELIRDLKRIGLLFASESSASANMLREIEAAARLLGLHMQAAEVRLPADLDAAFASLSKSRVKALVVTGSMLAAHGARVAALAAQYRLPAMYASTRPVEAGGLISYSVATPDLVRHLAVYVDRILKGAKPADLPIELPTKFEMVVNMKTAKALGLTIPPSILLRADRVIE